MMTGVGGISGSQPSNALKKNNALTLQDLQKQYPGLKISAQSFANEASIREYAMGQSGKYNVAIDPRAIARMGEDKEFAGKINDVLASVKEGDDWLEQKVNTGGTQLIASGTIIDKDGNVSGWAISQTTSESSSGKTQRVAIGGESREELLERLEQKRLERKDEEKRLKEKQSAEESLTIAVTVETDRKTTSAATDALSAASGSLDVVA